MKEFRYIKKLKEVEVFSDIKQESFDKIVEYGDFIKVKKNSCLYQDRCKLEYVYFVIEGKVTLSKNHENGENRVIFLVGPGKMINQPIMRKSTSAVECWAFEDSVLYRITFEKFDEIMSEDYRLVKNCMEYMEIRIRSLYRQLKNSVTVNIDKKLAAKLYRLASEYGIKSDIEGYTKINISVTNTYLSKMIGCQRETISRSMKSLIKEDIVRLEGRTILVNEENAKIYFRK